MARVFGTQINQPIPTGQTSQAGRVFQQIQSTQPVQSKELQRLKDITEQQGIQQEAQRVLPKGESPEQFGSGGIISDTFDVLNSLQYGVVGVLKGKSFVEGVRTRESFTKKDALGDKGIPGLIAGLALDIAVDPLTWIAPATIFKKIPGAIKATEAGIEAVKATRAGQAMGRALIYRFGQDPVYAKMAERSMRNIAVNNQNLLDLSRPLNKLDSESQRLIAQARKAGELEKLSPQLLAKAKPAFDELDRLGKEAVNVGLLKREVYNENVGTYLARLYRTKEEGGRVFGIKPQRIDLARFKARKDIPEDVREAMGEILEAGYPTAKALVQLNTAVERGKLFREVATKWGSDLAEEGMEQLANTPRLGALAGKYIPKPIADDINELIKPVQQGINKKIVAGFKFGKVILNPATHSRNIMSNFILNDFEGLSPARLDVYAKAAKSLITKDEAYQAARKAGLGLDTFATQELKSLLTAPEVRGLGSEFKSALDKVADLYQKEEEFAKMAQFIFQKSKGLSDEAAFEIAERATFNYAQVTPFIRMLRENIWGMPFITFTYKATPQVAKTLVTQPGKISKIGKIKNAIENQSDLAELSRERELEPDWIRDGFYVKLPIKDKFGRSSYLDLTYILPFGDLISGQFLERGIKRETGLPESQAEALLSKSPFLNLIKELGRNEDFFGNKIWKESDTVEKQLGDLMRHLVKTYSPPLISDQIPGGYRADGSRREGSFERVFKAEKTSLEEGGRQTRTAKQELLRLAGVKILPIDIQTQEYFNQLQQEKALETLIQESGGRKFERVFIPKEQQRSETKGRVF